MSPAGFFFVFFATWIHARLHTHTQIHAPTHTLALSSAAYRTWQGSTTAPTPPDSSSQLLQTLAIPPFWLRRPQTASLACHRHLPSDWSSPPPTTHPLPDPPRHLPSHRLDFFPGCRVAPGENTLTVGAFCPAARCPSTY